MYSKIFVVDERVILKWILKHGDVNTIQLFEDWAHWWASGTWQWRSWFYTVRNLLNSSRNTCTRHIHLLKFIYRLLKHNIHVNISNVKMGCRGKRGFIAWHMLCSAFGVKATDLWFILACVIIINLHCQLMWDYSYP